MIHKVSIRPLSVNKAWQWRRFKTPEYKNYEQILMYKLPKIEIPKGKIRIDYEFGFSNKLSDIDNPLKNFQDILTKKYWFKDSDIYELTIKKQIVPKGEEYVAFTVTLIE